MQSHSMGLERHFGRSMYGGETSREMLKDIELRNLIILARVASVGLYLGCAGVCLTFIWWALG